MIGFLRVLRSRRRNKAKTQSILFMGNLANGSQALDIVATAAVTSLTAFGLMPFDYVIFQNITGTIYYLPIPVSISSLPARRPTFVR